MAAGDATAKKAAKPSIMEKFFKNGQPWEKEELETAIHWMRQVLALVTGILWGIVPVTGIGGVFFFFLFNVLAVRFYYTSRLGIDSEDFGGHYELAREGMATAFSVFLLSWVITYSNIQDF
eukprot:jgi/Mesvir1/3740/Mv15016-RA.1